MVFCGWTPKITGEREKGEVGGGGESAWGREGNEVKVMKGRGKRKEEERRHRGEKGSKGRGEGEKGGGRGEWGEGKRGEWGEGSGEKGEKRE